eukprot:GHVN01082708.1.p1 GENE.GHVN01082708.1~~GHVN01082708.1.p1  ORF type:complete len:188 (+),score=29.51 GHVN01082708.1:424-987(+)
MGDTAAVLRGWLSNAEALVNAEKEKVAKAREDICMRCEDEVKIATELANDKIKIATEQAERNRDMQLEQWKLSHLDEIEKQVSSVQHQAEGYEMLGDMLIPRRKHPSTPSASSAPALQLQRPDEHLCPITTKVMTHPVTITCGDTFERSAILEWLESNASCPICREPSDKRLLPNKAVKKMIQDWKK